MRRLLEHLPEYAIEAALLGAFMVSACGFGVLLEHPGSPVHRAITEPVLRRVALGWPVGRAHQPGDHLDLLATGSDPRHRRGGLRRALASVLLGPRLAHPAVNYLVTRPGPWGVVPALLAEVLISGVLMAVVVTLTGSRWARYTGLVVGVLVATYIGVEAPISGMSMNPARSFGSAWVAGQWGMFWIYLVGPVVGMNLGSALAIRAKAGPACPKLDHPASQRCIFCGHAPVEELRIARIERS